ncbi:MAG: ABC transporter ATP-binding protein [Saprospiraceae bacterium]|nr:ABC transporter ATP-binding protein [Saprospiraceae bacterium]
MQYISSFKHLHRLLAFLAQNRRKTALAFLFDFTANLFLILGSVLLAQVVAATFGFQSLRGQLLNPGHWTPPQLLWLFLGIVCLRFLLDTLRLGLRGQLSEDFAYTLRMAAAEHHLQSDLRTHESRDAGRSLLRFAGDLGSIQQLLTKGMLQCAADISLLLIGIACIAALDFRLAVLVLVSVAGMLLGNRLLTRQLQHLEAQRRNKKAGLLAYINTLLMQLAAVQALNRTTRSTQQFEKKAKQIRSRSLEYQKIAAIQAALPPFFAQMLLAIVLWAGLAMGLSGTPVFIIIMILMWWRNPLMRLLRVSLVWKKGLLSLQKFEALLQMPRASEGELAIKKEPKFVLEFHNISLRLGTKQIFDHYTVRIEGQRLTHLILPGGAGKTTLVKLLAGQYQPDSGIITWNGTNIQAYTLRSLRQQIAFVSDAFPLVGTSLLDALSKSGQSEILRDTEVSIQKFQALFPEHLQGLDFHLKLKGVNTNLSSSQQRLLECLRAVLANKPLLVLDEPFAGLDTETARRLADYLLEQCKNTAMLLLTSDPQTPWATQPLK